MEIILQPQGPLIKELEQMPKEELVMDVL